LEEERKRQEGTIAKQASEIEVFKNVKEKYKDELKRRIDVNEAQREELGRLCALYLMNSSFVRAQHRARRAWSHGERSPLNMDVQCIRRLENTASYRVCDAVSFDLGFVQE
jgi:hypothetical protein